MTQRSRLPHAVGLHRCCRHVRRWLERALVVRHDFFAVPSELSLVFNLGAIGHKRFKEHWLRSRGHAFFTEGGLTAGRTHSTTRPRI